MTENYGVIYRDNLEPEHAELRAWFTNCMLADARPAYNGQVWQIESIIAHYSLFEPNEFVVEGSYYHYLHLGEAQ